MIPEIVASKGVVDELIAWWWLSTVPEIVASKRVSVVMLMLVFELDCPVYFDCRIIFDPKGTIIRVSPLVANDMSVLNTMDFVNPFHRSLIARFYQPNQF